jgi:hypothetical protein
MKIKRVNKNDYNGHFKDKPDYRLSISFKFVKELILTIQKEKFDAGYSDWEYRDAISSRWNVGYLTNKAFIHNSVSFLTDDESKLTKELEEEMIKELIKIINEGKQNIIEEIQEYQEKLDNGNNILKEFQKILRKEKLERVLNERCSD